VLTIQSGINKLRYATLIGIKQAKSKPLRKVAMAKCSRRWAATYRRSRSSTFPKNRKTPNFWKVSREVAKKLVERLKNEVRVI